MAKLNAKQRKERREAEALIAALEKEVAERKEYLKIVKSAIAAYDLKRAPIFDRCKTQKALKLAAQKLAADRAAVNELTEYLLDANGTLGNIWARISDTKRKLKDGQQDKYLHDQRVAERKKYEAEAELRKANAGLAARERELGEPVE